MANMLRIGELAQKSGVSVRALRYYEEQKLLHPARTPSRQRVYEESAVETVRFIQQMYAAGLNSANIEALLPCFDAGHTDAGQRDMLHARREWVRARRDELQEALDRLEDIIEETASHP